MENKDYKNLIYGLQGAKGASNSVINTAKRRGAARAIKQLPDKFNAGEARYTFKSNGKETQRLTQAQVKELQEKGSAGASEGTKQLLNGVFVKPSKEKFGITWTSRPIEYQYKPKGEIQKLLDDLQIQSQKSSMWNPGRQDYLSMTSEHNWSLPSISIGLGKNSVKEIIKRLDSVKSWIFYVSDTDDSQMLSIIDFFEKMRPIQHEDGSVDRYDLYGYNNQVYDDTLIKAFLMYWNRFDNTKQLCSFLKEVNDKIISLSA